MSGTSPVQRIGETIERSISIRHVFGEPVAHGEVTVIPVGQVVLAFGGGGGSALSARAPDTGERAEPGYDAEGAGGGGALRMTPLGALEITGTGVRFVRLRPLAPLLMAGMIGFALGMLAARRKA